ncbi:MAG: hypothetical protein ACPGJS_22215 [Flammeovirgaceae bacterium]
MTALSNHISKPSAEGQLTQAFELLTQLDQILHFMEVIDAETRITLPRITSLNRNALITVITKSQTKARSSHELEQLVTHYQQLEELHTHIETLKNKILSAKLLAGAQLYRQGKKLISSSNETASNTELHFPLQPNCSPQRTKSKICPRNELVPIAQLEGTGEF